MKLLELITAVNDKSLSKEHLEAYRDDISNVFAKMQFEMADVKKSKAIYFLENPDKSDKATERKWQGTDKGLREIELNHYCKATEEILRSLKSRLYSMYN